MTWTVKRIHRHTLHARSTAGHLLDCRPWQSRICVTHVLLNPLGNHVQAAREPSGYRQVGWSCKEAAWSLLIR